MLPYLSLIRTPLQVIIFFCGMGISGCIATVGYGILIENARYSKSIIWGLCGMAFYAILTWVFIGDSTTWSESFGLWLRGK